MEIVVKSIFYFFSISMSLLAVVGSFPLNVCALPVIHEIVYDGPGGDADDVFTELFGESGMVLAGWTLVGINGATGAVYRTLGLTGAVIPDDGLLVIATATASGDVLAQRDFVANVDWQNGPDAVQLRAPDGTIVDALQYGDALANNAGEGQPAEDVAAGQSLARDLFSTDTNNNVTDFVRGVPTPGVGPTATPMPEPGTWILVGLGLTGCAMFRRRSQ